MLATSGETGLPMAVPNFCLKIWPLKQNNNNDKEDVTECVYKVPCANCDKTYIGETGRKFGVRLQDHSNGVMEDVLNVDGTLPCSRDTLNRWHRNGAIFPLLESAALGCEPPSPLPLVTPL